MKLLHFFRRFLQPGNVACFSAFLIAIGIETDNVYVHHGLEIVGAVLAIIGFFLLGPQPSAPDAVKSNR